MGFPAEKLDNSQPMVFAVKDIVKEEIGGEPVFISSQMHKIVYSNPEFQSVQMQLSKNGIKIIVDDSKTGDKIRKSDIDVMDITELLPSVVNLYEAMKGKVVSSYGISANDSNFNTPKLEIEKKVVEEPKLEHRIREIGPVNYDNDPTPNGFGGGDGDGNNGGVERVITQNQTPMGYVRNWTPAYTQFVNGFTFGTSVYNGTNANIMNGQNFGTGYYRRR